MKKNIITKNVAVFIAFVIAIYEFIFLWQTINWDSSKLWGILAFVVSVLAVFFLITTYLMSLRYRQKKYYVSFPIELKESVDNLRLKNNISPDYGTDVLIPGIEFKDEIRKKISRTNICLVIISRKVSQLQKIEIQEMKKQKKQIIPIQSGDAYIPNVINNITPLIVEEGKLKDLILDLQ